LYHPRTNFQFFFSIKNYFYFEGLNNTSRTMNIKNAKKATSVGVLVMCVIVLCSNTIKPKSSLNQTFISDYENVLGTSLQIKVSATSKAEAALAENKAVREIDRLDRIISGYNQQSLNLFDQWRVRTDGAIDASAEVIGRLWKEAAKLNKTPSQNEIEAAVAMVKSRHYLLNQTNRTAQHLDKVPLMLNSFAKSYIINRAADAALQSAGVSGIVVNIGGDIVIRGNRKEQVQISNPTADAENDLPLTAVFLSNKAIATSGNYRRGELISGKWYSHIVDPRTGMPTQEIISSTVVAAKATDAGALATAFSVLTPVESATLAATIPGTEYLLITRDGKYIQSKGWKNIETSSIKPNVTNVAPTVLTETTWDTGYELLINLELAEIEGFRAHRPYVAVWVVDKNKKAVRNIAIWYNKDRYLDHMHGWYDTYYNSSSNISSTSSATRSPGKYTLKWDGKDDKGKLVNKGVYTIYIEAAREHGSYQLMSAQMDFSASPKQATLNGNTEISTASLDYRKKR
jgi:thiamine biosynthesis lipoprotein